LQKDYILKQVIISRGDGLLDEKARVITTSIMDAIVSIFMMITGIYVINFSMHWGDTVNMILDTPYYSSNPWAFTEPTPMIFLLIGITTILYGIKRLIDNSLKILVKTSESPLQQIRYYQPPVQTQDFQQTNQYNRNQF